MPEDWVAMGAGKRRVADAGEGEVTDAVTDAMKAQVADAGDEGANDAKKRRVADAGEEGANEDRKEEAGGRGQFAKEGQGQAGKRGRGQAAKNGQGQLEERGSGKAGKRGSGQAAKKGQGQAGKQGRSKAKGRSLRWMMGRMVRGARVLGSFRMKRLEIALDTGDPVLTARLYALNFYPYPRGKHIHINFVGDNYFLLRMTNRPWRILTAWFR